MRFIDANVFIYAVLRPKPGLSGTVLAKKNAAREIFLRVNTGEPVITTTVHLSEVANVLEDVAGQDFAGDLIASLLAKSTISVVAVSADDYRESVFLAKNYSMSINDALAIIVMERQGIQEIYTFDRHFAAAPVRVVQE